MSRKSSKQTTIAPTTNGAAKHGRVIRVVAITNPTTKHTVLAGATLDGRVSDARLAKRLGVKKVTGWVEVEASSWKEATKLFRAGKGKKVALK